MAIQDLPHWHDEPEVWDTVFLGGVQMPGVAKVKVTRKRKIDKKSAKGKNKGKVTTQGTEPAEVSISLRMLSEEDKAALVTVMPLLEPVPDKETVTDKDALEIASYATNYRSISAIIIESLEGPELRDDGILYLDIKACEFDADSVTKKGVGTGTGGSGLKIGFFTDQQGQPLPQSYVAYEGAQAKDDKGKLIVDPYGKPIFVCTQVAISNTAGQMTSLEATFLGRFHSDDPLLKQTWDAFAADKKAAKTKDATNTPQKAKGPDLSDFSGSSDNDQPDPADTDAGPDA